MKRLLTVLIVLVLIFTSTVACTQKSNNEASSTEAVSTNTVAPTTTQVEVKNLNPTGLPIVKDKITITAMQQKDPRFGQLDKLWTTLWLEEKTNIHIEYEEIDQQSWVQKKQLAFASNELPDIFIAAVLTTNDEVLYGADGKMLAPLNELIDKYAPNILQAFSDYPVCKPSITAPDGNIYALPSISEGPLMLGIDRTFINKKWLDNLGMAMPKTVEEMYSVLKAFKEKDPDRNGQNDTIPLSGRIGVDPEKEVQNTIRMYFYAYGLSGNRISISTKDKSKIEYSPYTPEYEKILTELNRLYKEGLMDSDYFIQTAPELKAKSSEVRVGVCNWGAPFGMGGMPDPANYLQYEGVYPLVSEAGAKPIWRGVDIIEEGNFAMSAKNKNPEATIRWADYLYSEEAGIKLYFGPDVGEWDQTKEYGNYIDSNGKVAGKLPEGKTKFLYTVSTWSNRALTLRVPKLAYKEAFAPTDTALSETLNKAQAPFRYDLFPRVYFDTKDQERLIVLEADIKSYVDQMEAKFITGVEPLSNFKSYLENLKKIGVEEYIKINQGAYDVFLKNQ